MQLIRFLSINVVTLQNAWTQVHTPLMIMTSTLSVVIRAPVLRHRPGLSYARGRKMGNPSKNKRKGLYLNLSFS